MDTPDSRTRRRIIGFAAAGGALLALASPARAQTQKYPERYIKIVSITSPGTVLDDYSRQLAKYLGEALGQSVVVENRPGANMSIATDYVAKAAPDGYTLLLAASSAMSANPFLFKRLPYDPVRDFVPLARVSSLSLALLVPGTSPFKTVAELVAAGRAKPGSLNCATVSTGYRVIVSAFNEAAGIKSANVPYKSAASLLPDLISGVVDYSVVEASYILPQLQSGKLRALAMLSAKRLPQAPGVPTLAETGMQDAAMADAISRISWVGLFAPAGTPAAIVSKLERLILEFATSPTAMAHHATHGTMPNPGTGAELGKTVISDQAIWKRMIAVSGLQPE